jgi:hypothetical protein
VVAADHDVVVDHHPHGNANRPWLEEAVEQVLLRTHGKPRDQDTTPKVAPPPLLFVLGLCVQCLICGFLWGHSNEFPAGRRQLGTPNRHAGLPSCPAARAMIC